MENNNSDMASYSWWWGTHNNTPHQSQWLQTSISDLDEKTKAMLSLIIQEDGDSFAQRAEMYYKNRPQLIKMVEEFHRSYRSLAERYDQLKSESARVCDHSGSSSSNSFKHIQNLPSLIISKESNNIGSISTTDSNPESCIVEDPDVLHPDQSDTTTKLISIEPITKLNSKEELIKIIGNINHEEGECGRELGGVTNKKTNYYGCELGKTEDGEFANWGCLARETIWSDMKFQVSKLMEENLQQQSELIRRNDEKREAIKDLCFQIDKLREENRTLQNCCFRCSRVNVLGMKKQHHHHQSQLSRLKGLILGKFLGGCPPAP